MSIDEGMPSEVALVYFLVEFYRNLSSFLFLSGHIVPSMEDNAIRGYAV